MKTHVQLKKQATDSPVQAKAGNQANRNTILQTYKNSTSQLASLEEEPAQRKENKTGLPDNLKSGVENLSGHSLDDVKVHYNSTKPAELQAHAYAQGTDIHVAPGQEKHLPHEAWHVAQQKQGRVKPTKQLMGKTPVNDDTGLEKEADVMGAKAMQMKAEASPAVSTGTASNSTIAQLTTKINHTTGNYSYMDHSDNTQKDQTVGTIMEAFLDPGDEIKGSATGGPQKDFISNIRTTFPNDNMIRGHLLNHDLGGFGVEQNLFPITSYANGLHLRKVEYGVKDALVAASAANRGVYYRVEVTGAMDDTADAPVSTFECVANRLNDVNDETSIGAQILRANIISSPKKSGPKRDSEAKGSANNGAGGAAATFGHSSGLAAWRHGSRNGKLNFDDLITSGKITSAVRNLAGPVDGGFTSIEEARLAIDENVEEMEAIYTAFLAHFHYDSMDDAKIEDFQILTSSERAVCFKVASAVVYIEEHSQLDSI